MCSATFAGRLSSASDGRIASRKHLCLECRFRGTPPPHERNWLAPLSSPSFSEPWLVCRLSYEFLFWPTPQTLSSNDSQNNHHRKVLLRFILAIIWRLVLGWILNPVSLLGSERRKTCSKTLTSELCGCFSFHWWVVLRHCAHVFESNALPLLCCSFAESLLQRNDCLIFSSQSQTKKLDLFLQVIFFVCCRGGVSSMTKVCLWWGCQELEESESKESSTEESATEESSECSEKMHAINGGAGAGYCRRDQRLGDWHVMLSLVTWLRRWCAEPQALFSRNRRRLLSWFTNNEWN